jgi:ribulose-5-phosphate 4-epimerase/fuculose-1-phosphate aldolase
MHSSTAIHQEIIASGRQMWRRGLVWGCSGNISRRTGNDSFLISASGANLGALTADDLAECSVSTTAHRGPSPSRETPLHRAAYQLRSQVQAVVHSSPFYTTLVACGEIPLRTDLFPEAMAYLGHVAWVPYHHPGSQMLADAVAAQGTQSNVLILLNHGAVILGRNLEEALLRLETLEFLCRLETTARAGGIALRYLGKEATQAFRDRYQAQSTQSEESGSCCD